MEEILSASLNFFTSFLILAYDSCIHYHTISYLYEPLTGKGRQIVDALNEGTLNFIRMETSKGEIMVALEENLILIILKDKTTMRDQDDGD